MSERNASQSNQNQNWNQNFDDPRFRKPRDFVFGNHFPLPPFCPPSGQFCRPGGQFFPFQPPPFGASEPFCLFENASDTICHQQPPESPGQHWHWPGMNPNEHFCHFVPPFPRPFERSVGPWPNFQNNQHFDGQNGENNG